MSDTPPSSELVDEVTKLLRSSAAGDVARSERLLELVYAELKRIAHRQLSRERFADTLQTTALVHEAYLRLVGQHELSWENRRHFFGIAARAMRQILVDHARHRHARKRDGGHPVTLDDAVAASAAPAEDILGVDEALGRLAAVAPRAAQVVELRYFAGLSLEETAEALGVAPATVKRDWMSARAWLQRELS
jgi:RNA polymerase sigma factor (TIGR02999 family)